MMVCVVIGDSSAGQKVPDGKDVKDAASKVSTAVSEAGECLQPVHE